MSRYIYQSGIRDGNGVIISDAIINVFLAGSTTPANVYTDTSVAVPVHSVYTNEEGRYSFYVDSTEYGPLQKFRFVITKDRFAPATIDNISLCRQDIIIECANQEEEDIAIANGYQMWVRTDLITAVTTVAPNPDLYSDIVMTLGDTAPYATVVMVITDNPKPFSMIIMTFV